MTMYVPPNLTTSEEKRLGMACIRRDKRSKKAIDIADRKIQLLQDRFYRQRKAIEAACTLEKELATKEYQEQEDAVYSAIFDEEERTGVKRDTGSTDMCRWYALAGAKGYENYLQDSPSAGRKGTE